MRERCLNWELSELVTLLSKKNFCAYLANLGKIWTIFMNPLITMHDVLHIQRNKYFNHPHICSRWNRIKLKIISGSLLDIFALYPRIPLICRFNFGYTFVYFVFSNMLIIIFPVKVKNSSSRFLLSLTTNNVSETGYSSSSILL